MVKQTGWRYWVLATVWMAACSGGVTELGEIVKDDDGVSNTDSSVSTGFAATTDGWSTTGTPIASSTGFAATTGRFNSTGFAATTGRFNSTGFAATTDGWGATGAPIASSTTGYASTDGFSTTGFAATTDGWSTTGTPIASNTAGYASTTGGFTTTGSAVTSGTTTGGASEELRDCSREDCPGLCFGTACNGEWQCHTNVLCSGESVAWCSCDGETFFAPSGCPTRAFEYMGECSD